jgi:ankyrin repeat protein
MRAAYIGYPELVKYLLAHGADKTLKDYDGNMAIHYVRKECLADLKDLLK